MLTVEKSPAYSLGGRPQGLEFGDSVRAVDNRVGWRRIVEMSSDVVPRQPS